MSETTAVSKSVEDSAVKVSRVAFVPNGFGYGLRQEFLRATVAIKDKSGADWAAVDRALAALIPDSGEGGPAATSTIDRIIRWTAEIQRAGGGAVFDTGRVIATQHGAGLFKLALPTSDAAAADAGLRIVTDIIAAVLDGAEAEMTATMSPRIDAYVKRFQAKILGGSNTIRFLKAAHDRNIPWFRLSGQVFQIGMGSKARWLDSSFTDATTVIGTNLARNKIAAAQIMRQSGLPAPRHAQAATPEAAVKIAEQLGYPVVVKPVDRDGGTAVAAGLKDAAGVIKAFEVAKKASASVMVEKHVEGRDYRLVVFEGRLIWALERVPGSVTGDGVSTVEALLERLNSEPARAPRRDAPLKPVLVDEEALDLLAERGMSLSSVPEAGEWIRLRRAANVASGGTPVGAFDRVHPDNRVLAERAARALRLDIAGIDLLIRDISRSWMETGAIICEVNAQPTIGYTTSAHLYGEILAGMVKDRGRIPIVLIAGADPDSPAPVLVAQILSANGLRVGMADARHASLDGTVINSTPGDVFTAARMVLLDNRTQAAVVSVSDASIVKTGLPFDRCSAVVLAGTRFDGLGEGPVPLNGMAHLMLPASLRGVAIDARVPEWLALRPSISRAHLVLFGETDTVAVQDHAKAGLPAVFLDNGPDGPRLRIGAASLDLRALTGGQSPIPCCAEDIVLAASTALALGYAPDAIVAGLANARLA